LKICACVFRISNEIEHFQHISYEAIVRVIGWFEKEDDNVGLIMEYLNGGNLLQLIENKDINLKPLLCLRMCADIANGLKYLHDLPPNGLVHGNLKTENVLLTDSLRCKITGLGLANVHVDCSENKPIPECIYEGNEESMIFVDPELINNRSITAAFPHDVYSFSIIVYEVLARKRSFIAPQECHSYQKLVLKGQRPDISGIIETINHYRRQKENFDGEISILEKLRDVMKRCWLPTPSDRPLMSRVKFELVNLQNKFVTTEVLQDAAKATKTLNPKPIIYDSRCLVPIHFYLKPSKFNVNYNSFVTYSTVLYTNIFRAIDKWDSLNFCCYLTNFQSIRIENHNFSANYPKSVK